MYQLYGHQNSGAAAIEAALELCEVPYRFIDVSSSPEAVQALEKLNPLKQIPTLQLPDGGVLTESAAILIHLGLTFPESNLLPENPLKRDQVIRGLVYIVSNCYAAIGIIDYPERWLAEADESSREKPYSRCPPAPALELGGVCRSVRRQVVPGRGRAGRAGYSGGGGDTVGGYPRALAHRAAGVLCLA